MALRVIVRRESADYIQCDSYTSASGLPPALLEPLSVWQRTLLHIPPPGHAYWTADTGDPSHCTWGVERRAEFSALGPGAAVSWPWVPAWGSLEPPRQDGENAQKTGKNGEKMGEIRPKECEPRELTKDLLAARTPRTTSAAG